MRLPLAALALALAAVLAGCTSTTTPSTTSTSATHTQPPAHDMAPKTVDVILQGNAFVNQTLTIYEGDTVRWTHRDGMTPHNVASDSPAFDSHPLCKPPAALPLAQVCMVDGNQFSYKFSQAGEVGYRCDLHSSMVGTIHVLAHPTA